MAAWAGERLRRVPPTHSSMLQAGRRADPVDIRIRELSLTTHQLQPFWREQALHLAWTKEPALLAKAWVSKP